MTIYSETSPPICKHCRINQCDIRGKNVNGYNLYRKHCRYCHVAKYYKPWLLHRKNICERCGFVPEHISQLDVDHYDSNKNNNSPSNLITLCANCHRLKTHLNEDYKNKRYKKMGAIPPP